MVPMVSSIIPTIFHNSPVGPGPWGPIDLHIPDSLAPDNIFNPQGSMVVHRPLSHSTSDGVSVLNHEIQCQTEPMVAGLISVTPDGVHSPTELVQNLVTSRNDMGLAVARRNGWDAVARWQATFKISWSRAKVRYCRP